MLNPLAGLPTCPTCAKGGNVWRSRVSSAFPFSARLDGEFIPFEIDPPEFLARAYFYSSPSSSGSRTPRWTTHQPKRRAGRLPSGVKREERS